MDKSLKAKIKALPTKPGVYLFKDFRGTVLYIGKAKNLKNRVKSYLKPETVRTQMLMKNAVDVEYTVVGSELEALMLETNRIKQLRPKYNILMKDDKNYAYIRITLQEDFPRIDIVRKITRDGARYFGPKTSVTQIEKLIQMMQRLFPVRTCSLNIVEKEKNLDGTAQVDVTHKTIKYPCLLYHMKKCIAPCIGACTKDAYRTLIDGVISFLSGKTETIVAQITQEMQVAVQEKRFERAAQLRDLLRALETAMAKQNITTTDYKDQDIIGLSILGSHVYFSVFLVRSGKVIHQENFVFNRADTIAEGEEELKESIAAYLTQYYAQAGDLPEEILIPYAPEDTDTISEWIAKETGKKIELRVPQKGRARELVQLAQENAAHFASQQMTQWEINEKRTKGAALELQKILNIPHALHRIECYDISHLGGTETVGSMVVAIDGMMKNNLYRHFRLRSVQRKIDDYAAHAEVITRRLRYLAEQARLPEGITVKKATKKEIKIIYTERPLGATQLTFEEAKDALHVIAYAEKKLIGSVRAMAHAKETFTVESLWVKEEERGSKIGHFLLKKLIALLPKKAKIYICCKQTLVSYYEASGFREISNPPQEIFRKECQSTEYKTMRYLPRTEKIDPSFVEKPDLIVIDGGKGQLAAAEKVLQHNHKNIPVIALAKREEEIFMPQTIEPLCLPKESVVLHLLQRLRDESHRFALTYQRKRRSMTFIS